MGCSDLMTDKWWWCVCFAGLLVTAHIVFVVAERATARQTLKREINEFVYLLMYALHNCPNSTYSKMSSFKL